MSMAPKDLEMITATTVGHYERGADDYWAATRDHDVSQNVAALLDHIEGPPPLALLDFGCGPGRDLKTFKDLGHHAIGLDGAKQFVAMAREYAGCEVWHQNFLQLSLPRETFDGIFANAVLFHVPSQEVPSVLVELRMALKPGGVLFSSNPRGDGQEGWRGSAMARFTICQRGEHLCGPPGSLNWSTSTVLPDYPSSSGRGWLQYGETHRLEPFANVTVYSTSGVQ